MQPNYRWTTCLRSSRQNSEDCAEVLSTDDRLVIVLADGAGGMAGGASAAAFLVDRVVAALSAASPGMETPNFWAALLRDVDRRLAEGGRGGETTAVIAAISNAGLVGASVGDSEAWVVNSQDVDDLTSDAERKTRIGSGRALPFGFRRS